MRIALVVVMCSSAVAAAAPPVVLTGLPPPDASAAHEELPAGAACRIGSDHLSLGRDYGEVVFGTDGKLYTEGLGAWTKLDASSGKELEQFAIASVTSGISASGTCVATLVKKSRVDLFKFPARTSVAHHQFPEDKDSDVIPADDCSAAIQKQGYGKACVTTFGAGFAPGGEVCAGIELAASAISADGKRVALVPSRMSKDTYAGDGVHVFDLATRRELMVVKAKEPGAAVALSRDGQLVAFVDRGAVRIARNGAVVATTPLAPKFRVRSLVFSPSGKRLAIASEDDEKRLDIVDTATGAAVLTQRELPTYAQVRFRDDDVVAYTVGGGFRVVDVRTGADVVARGRLYQIAARAMTPDGERAVIASKGHLSVWNARTCALVRDLDRMPELVQIATTPDGKLAVGYTNDGLVRVDLATGAHAAVAFAHRHRDSTAISADGTLALIGADIDGKAAVIAIDLATMKVAHQIPIPGVGLIGALAVTPAQKHVWAVGPGGMANGDTPVGGSTVTEIDLERGAIVKQWHIDGAEQDYEAAIVERGATIAVNGERFDLAGKPLPKTTGYLHTTSSDGATLLWSDGKGSFVWPADKPMPTNPTHVMGSIGWSAVGAGAMLSCSAQTCLVSSR